MEKTLDKITRNEWIAYSWENVTASGEEMVRLLRGRFRTPDEGALAAREWDAWRDSAHHIYQKSKHIYSWTCGEGK